jgi:hypothetical protein
VVFVLYQNCKIPKVKIIKNHFENGVGAAYSKGRSDSLALAKIVADFFTTTLKPPSDYSC